MNKLIYAFFLLSLITILLIFSLRCSFDEGLPRDLESTPGRPELQQAEQVAAKKSRFDDSPIMRDSATLSVTIMVVDEVGSPVPGADVWLTRRSESSNLRDSIPAESLHSTADHLGDARFVDISEGVYVASCSKEGWLEVRAQFDINWNKRSHTISLLRGRMVCGHVRFVDRQPAIGATVSAVPISVGNTDAPQRVRKASVHADGSFAISGLPDGGCELTAFADGYAMAGPCPLVITNEPVDINILLVPMVAARVRWVDQASGSAIALPSDARVQVRICDRDVDALNQALLPTARGIHAKAYDLQGYRSLLICELEERDVRSPWWGVRPWQGILNVQADGIETTSPILLGTINWAMENVQDIALPCPDGWIAQPLDVVQIGPDPTGRIGSHTLTLDAGPTGIQKSYACPLGARVVVRLPPARYLISSAFDYFSRQQLGELNLAAPIEPKQIEVPIIRSITLAPRNITGAMLSTWVLGELAWWDGRGWRRMAGGAPIRDGGPFVLVNYPAGKYKIKLKAGGQAVSIEIDLGDDKHEVVAPIL